MEYKYLTFYTSQKIANFIGQTPDVGLAFFSQRQKILIKKPAKYAGLNYYKLLQKLIRHGGLFPRAHEPLGPQSSLLRSAAHPSALGLSDHQRLRSNHTRPLRSGEAQSQF